MAKGTTKAFRTQAYIFKRYLWLVSVLLDCKQLSYQEISDKWAVSSLNDGGIGLPKRTFHDHISAIQELFGVSIVNENRGDYRYYLENVNDIRSNTLRSWILDNFSVGNVLMDAKDLQNRIFVQDIPSSKRWLSSIISAIRSKNVVRVEYTSYLLGKVPILYLCPLFLKLYDNRWYMYAREVDGKIMKHYALDRIELLTIQDEKFSFTPSSSEYFSMKHCFGHSIYQACQPQEIYLKASHNAARFLDSLPLHPSQVKIKETEDVVFYRYFFAMTPDVEIVLRKWDGLLKILSEEEIRNL